MTTCRKCRKPIQPQDRWYFVYRRFLWWTWRRREHRDCRFPTMGAAPQPDPIALHVAEGRHDAR
jgi:hypothetical protein